MRVEFEVLQGKTLKDVRVSDDRILFTTEDGEQYVQEHSQECCEKVWLEDVCGNTNDLIGSPILLAEEVSNKKEIDGHYEDGYEYCSETWTFYKLATIRGYVTIRWYGKSHGYYSEQAALYKSERPYPPHCIG